MPTPVHRRPVPAHVEIPVLPDAMAPWLDLVNRAEGKEARWRKEPIDVDHVVDGLSAAHVLADFRYSGRRGEWIDEAGEGPGEWRREWIVVARSEGDPFIVDLSQTGLPVLRADHGAGEWEPTLVHPTLAGFLEDIELVDPQPVEPYLPPDPDARDSSITIVDWGAERSTIITALVKHHPNLYQRPMFRRKVETPVVLTRRMTRWQADRVAEIVERHGGEVEIGAAITKEPRVVM